MGAACLLGGVAYGLLDLRFRLRASTATGIVRSVGATAGGSFFAVIQFQTATGREVVIERRNTWSEERDTWHVGTTVGVAYDPSDPTATATLSNYALAGYGLLLFIGGLSLAAGEWLRRR